MTIIGEETALERLRIFADETSDYTIRAVQFRPDVRELLALVSRSPEVVTVMREALEKAIAQKLEVHEHGGLTEYGEGGLAALRALKQEFEYVGAALLKVTLPS